MNKISIQGERAWFNHAKFGMFIHLGLYSLMGENENAVRKGSKEAYAAYMHKFNPADFDAHEWVQLALDAGCTYIVITAKHADGFCLWHTDQSSYNIMNTPFRRDLVKELSTACQGKIRFGIYYNGNTWLYDKERYGEFNVETYPVFCREQLSELMTNYGDICELWFDHSDDLWPEEQIRDAVNMCRELQPSLVVNDRAVDTRNIPACVIGDFATPERHIPDYLEPEHVPLECCDSIERKGWGYMSHCNSWSTSELLRRLSKSCSIGANYLLNVSPTPAGVIRQEHCERMRSIGQWLQVNRDAIFNAGACPVVPLDNALQNYPVVGATTIDGNTLYVHVHRELSADSLFLANISGTVKQAEVFGRVEQLDYYFQDHESSCSTGPDVPAGIVIEKMPDAASLPHIVKIEFESPPVINFEGIAESRKKKIQVYSGQTIMLEPEDAWFTSECGIPWQEINHFSNGNVSIGHIIRYGVQCHWDLENIPEAGHYKVFIDLGTMEAQADAEFSISLSGQSLKSLTVENGWYDVPERMELGTIEIKPGSTTLTLKVDYLKSCFSDIHRIVLQPVKNMENRNEKSVNNDAYSGINSSLCVECI